MEVNRNQYLFVGLVVVFLGLQFRMVESYVLNENASRFLVERIPALAKSDNNLMPAVGPTPKRTLKPPPALGYAVLSVGAVLILHSLAMRRPD